MEMPYSSNRCNPHRNMIAANAGPDVTPSEFGVYAESSSLPGAADYGRGTSVDVLQDSMLMMGQSHAAASFQAASRITSMKLLEMPLQIDSSADMSATSGMWTYTSQPLTTSTVGSSMNQQHSHLKRSSNEGSMIMSCTSTGPGMVVKSGGGLLGMSHDAGCLEQLLVYCMTAIENNDATLAQQLVWVLNNTVSIEGDPNQRVAAYFLRALISRAARLMSSPGYALPPHLQARDTLINSTRALSAIELAGFVDLTPWHRFGFSASNGAILWAAQGRHSVHIVDFSITHCMQWPTLIEALLKCEHGPPPRVRLTVHSARPHVPPVMNMSFEEVGMKLTAFAKFKKVPFQFNVLPQKILS
ncbi:hypothetical protein L7F22_035750 [Adiantum nelumboides]|nr:hypothetical protein [Adiantum nelumboides]